MTALRRLAASVLLPGFAATNVPAWLAEWLDEGLAGVCLFGQNVVDPAQTRALTDELHACRRGVLVASDEEGGTVSRLEAQPGSSWPGHATLGALDDLQATYDVARGLGAQARRAGVDLVAAPVVDVNSEPDNPVIGIRSFGADTDLVARHGAAFVRGLQASGVAACAKHFPGHGATRVDSHESLPVLDSDADTLRRRDLPPFAAAVAAGARCVMTAHVVVTAVDARPATMSPPTLRMLREELGFIGVVVSDALDMRAISHGVGRAAGAVRALASGVDLLCVGNPCFPDPYDERLVLEELVTALSSAVEDGSLPRLRLEQASGRVQDLASWTAAQAEAPPVRVSRPGFGVEVAARALRVRGRVGVAGDAVVVVPRTVVGLAAGRRESTLVSVLTARRPEWKVVEDVDAKEAASLTGRTNAGALVVVVDGRLDADLERAVGTLVARRGDAIVVYGALAGPDDPGRNTIHTFGGGRATAEAVADLMLAGDR